MANERIYLYCRNCGARFYLGKHYETDYDGVSDFGIVYESSAIYMKMPGGDNL